MVEAAGVEIVRANFENFVLVRDVSQNHYHYRRLCELGVLAVRRASRTKAHKLTPYLSRPVPS